MPSLEELIESEARKGKITHITLAPTRDGRWQAGYRDTGSSGYNVAIDKNPITALVTALRQKGEDQNKAKSKSDIAKRNADLI